MLRMTIIYLTLKQTGEYQYLDAVENDHNLPNSQTVFFVFFFTH